MADENHATPEYREHNREDAGGLWNGESWVGDGNGRGFPSSD